MKNVIHLRRLRIDLALPLIDDYVLNNLLKHFPIVGLEIKLARGQRTFPYKTESIHTVLINNAKSLKAQELFGIKAAHLVDARGVSITAMDICDLVEDLISKRRPLFNRYFTPFNEKFDPEEIKTAFLSLGDVCRFVEDHRWVITRPEEELPFLELFLGQYSGSLMVCVTDVAVRTPVELSLPENVPEPVSEGPVVPEEVTVPVVETVTEDQIPAKTTKKGLAKVFKQLKARFFKQRSFPDSRSMNSS